MNVNQIQPGYESWVCRLAGWWQGLSHHRQNLVFGAGAVAVTLAVVALIGALGLSSGPHWVWNITN